MFYSVWWRISDGPSSSSSIESSIGHWTLEMDRFHAKVKDKVELEFEYFGNATDLEEEPKGMASICHTCRVLLQSVSIHRPSYSYMVSITLAVNRISITAITSPFVVWLLCSHSAIPAALNDSEANDDGQLRVRGRTIDRRMCIRWMDRLTRD